MHRVAVLPSPILRDALARWMGGGQPEATPLGAGRATWEGQDCLLVGPSPDRLPIRAALQIEGQSLRSLRPRLVVFVRPDTGRTWAYLTDRPRERFPVRVRGLGLTEAQDGPGPGRDLSRLIGALGGPAMRRLASARFGVVGVGSLGSGVAALLAQAGAQRFVLVDPDRLEASNLHRMPTGLGELDVGEWKVEAVARLLHLLGASETVGLPVPIHGRAAREALRDCDLVLVATDEMGSRHVAAQFASDFLIPAVGVGTGVGETDDGPPGLEVGLAMPGDGCLACVMALPAQGRFDFGTGRRGSLGSLNAVAAGLAVRVVEDIASGQIGASDAWGYTWLRGLRSRGLPRRRSCPCAHWAGIGDDGLDHPVRSFGGRTG